MRGEEGEGRKEKKKLHGFVEKVVRKDDESGRESGIQMISFADMF